MHEDHALLKHTLNGDRAAFDGVVRRYQDPLFRHLLRLTGNTQDAEDLTQESFIRFYRSLRRFNLARPVAPFLFAIATNLWRDRGRQARPVEQPLDEQSRAAPSSVTEQVMQRLEHQEIIAAVSALRPEQREAVSLYYDQGLSYREIAQVTRVPVGTVSTRLRLALEHLRRMLPGEAAGLVIVAGGQTPSAANLVAALHGQAGAPAALVHAIAQGVSHIAPAGAGLVHGAVTLWKGAGVMTKAAYVAASLAVVGGLAAGVPRVVSGALAAANRHTKGAAAVRQFSADITFECNGAAGQYKVYIKGPKVRHDTTDPNGKPRIAIWHYDKGIAWNLSPDTRTYTEGRFRVRPDSQWAKDAEWRDLAAMRADKSIAAVRLIGSGMMSGYQCDEYAITFREPSNGAQHVWIARKLKWVVRREVSRPAALSGSSQATKIRVGRIPDSLFEIPAGYRKAEAAKVVPPASVSSAHSIALAFRMFAQDYGRLPNAATWMDDVKPYMSNESQALHCPGDAHTYSFAMNTEVGGMRLSDIANPGSTVVLYEFSSDSRNASGEPPSPSVRGLLPGGRVYAYADGTARFVRAK